MKIYRVWKYGKYYDCEGRDHVGGEEARYFLNKKDALALYDTGKYYENEYRIYDNFKINGKESYTIVSEFIANKRKTEDPDADIRVIQLEKNHYHFEEIEVE